jgi:hypothetical protein
MGFSDLERAIPDFSQKMLIQLLRLNTPPPALTASISGYLKPKARM